MFLRVLFKYPVPVYAIGAAKPKPRLRANRAIAAKKIKKLKI